MMRTSLLIWRSRAGLPLSCARASTASTASASMKSRPGIGLPSAKRYAGSIAVSVAPASTTTQDM